MPGKRPAPLSDDVFAGGQAKVVGGALVGGAPMQVKNTFIDMPSGLTPSNMTNFTARPMMTAPPDLTTTPGFLQRAINAGGVIAAAPVDRSAVQTPASSSLGNTFRQANFTPLASPSPTMYSRGFGPNNAGPLAATFGIPGAGLLQNANVYPAGPAASYTMPAGSQRIPAPPNWNPSVSMPPSAVIASAMPTVPVGMSAPPAWAPTVGIVISSSTAPMAAPAAMPMFLERGPTMNSDFIEDDEVDDDSDGELPPHLRNMEDAPKPPPGALHPSEGSEAHDAGACKRCCFFPRGRCTNGYNCEFCHYEHEKRKRKNKKKKKKDGAALTTGATVLPATTVLRMVGPGATMPTAGYTSTYTMAAPAMAPITMPQAQSQVVYSTAPPTEQMTFQSYATAPSANYSMAAPTQQAVAPQVAAPAGFVSFQAADGRQVFVQQTAPQPQAQPVISTMPPLATQPVGTLLQPPRAPPPAPLGMPDYGPMPPPMESPKLPMAFGGPLMPPPMASPKLTRGPMNLSMSVQQAAANPAPQYSAYSQPVWVDNATGPLFALP